ncbi:hypothetical protein [Candidatus Electrothrix sp.]|uniref:hypothetical protein n=1 Tax=Candidatus Electrothrix sp. TaxID=2170559 RepID=UPI0040565D9F
MLALKDAIKKAFELFEVIYEGEKLPNRLLEEIEYDDSSDSWKVVIGFDSNHIIKKTEANAITGGTSIEERKRKYKQIRLKGGDGSFVKMSDQAL